MTDRADVVVQWAGSRATGTIRDGIQRVVAGIGLLGDDLTVVIACAGAGDGEATESPGGPATIVPIDTAPLDRIPMITALPRVIFPAVGVLILGGGATTTGALTAAIAVGGILAGVFSGGLTRVRWQGQVIVWAITGWGLSVLVFGLVLVGAGRTSPAHVLWPALVAALVVLAVAGACDTVSSVFRQTILQTAAPDEMRGRLQGVFTVVVAGGPRLGDLWVGTLSSRVGEAWAATAGGALCVVLLWLVVRAQRHFWHYDAHNPQP